jgi:hypothetical protein
MKKVSLRAKPSVSAQHQSSVVQQQPPAPRQPPQQAQQQQTPKQRQQPMRKAKQLQQPATSAARVAGATHSEILAPVRHAETVSLTGTRGLALVAGSIGPLRRAFLTWISEFLTGRFSMPVSHLRPKLALNPETSKKE